MAKPEDDPEQRIADLEREAGFRRNPTPFEIVMQQLPKLSPEERRAIWKMGDKEFGGCGREGNKS